MMHAETYLAETAEIAQSIDPAQIESMAAALSKIKGRVYMVGLGGSLANCIHMAADLRKLCCIDAVAPDNIADLTAWANDDGVASMLWGHLIGITERDALFVLSVGGGTGKVSRAITVSCQAMNALGIPIFGIVGPNGGETARLGQHVIKIPAPNPKHVTPHTEAFQMVIAHCLVSHPLLQKRKTKW